MTAERIKRQSILDWEDPPNLWVVLDETVLRRHVGSSTIMHEALMHVADIPDVLLTEAVQDQTTQHAPLLRTAHEIFDRVRVTRYQGSQPSN